MQDILTRADAAHREHMTEQELRFARELDERVNRLEVRKLEVKRDLLQCLIDDLGCDAETLEILWHPWEPDRRDSQGEWVVVLPNDAGLLIWVTEKSGRIYLGTEGLAYSPGFCACGAPRLDREQHPFRDLAKLGWHLARTRVALAETHRLCASCQYHEDFAS